MNTDVLDHLTIRDLIRNWVVWRDWLDWKRFPTAPQDDGRTIATPGAGLSSIAQRGHRASIHKPIL
jgi:hypothetical protein